MRLFIQAVSLGDVNSLTYHPASTTHSFISADARQRQGITDNLIRLSVGIEDADDLIADLDQALQATYTSRKQTEPRQLAPT